MSRSRKPPEPSASTIGHGGTPRETPSSDAGAALPTPPITGAHDLRGSLDRAQADLLAERAGVSALQAELRAVRAELDDVHLSLSWRLTAPLRGVWDFASGLGPFLREMRGFRRRAQLTIAARGAGALLSDIRSELSKRLRRGTLAAPRPTLPTGVDAAALPFAVRTNSPLRFYLPTSPQASIVVPAWNEYPRTFACLASVLERTLSVTYEVIVVDDGSTDETRRIDELIGGIRTVRLEGNAGFLRACNAGAAIARGEFLVFLNNDTLVSKGWLGQLLGAFEGPRGDGEVGLAGAKLVYPDGRLQEAGGIIFRDGSGWNYGRGDDPSNPKYEFQCDAHYCSGACIAIRRELFEDLGGFDEQFAPMYYEDVDLAFAVRAKGRRVVCRPSCLVVHFEGGTAGTDTGSGAKRFQTLNQGRFVAKWHDALQACAPPGTDPDQARYLPTGPHVLVMDTYTPRVDRDAGSVRMSNVMRILKEMGCHVTFLAENRAREGDHTLALQLAGIEAMYAPYASSIEQHLKDWGRRYDTVIMSRLEVASDVIEAVRRHCPGARRVFDTVDLHFLREERAARLEIGAGMEGAARTKALELAVARACDLTLVVSTAEQAILAREAPDVAVEVLSLIMTPEPTDAPFEERSGILFIGNFQHPPNEDAVRHYLRDIHPAVQERLPEVTFTVVGPHLPPSMVSLGDDAVRFAGQLSDIRAAFGAARLSVAPLRYGAGIKGKIHTSLAFGVPVVSTSVGVEGMQLVPGRDILVADTPEEFADAVVRLYENADLWADLADGGLRSVTDQFSVDRARTMLRNIVTLRSDHPVAAESSWARRGSARAGTPF